MKTCIAMATAALLAACSPIADTKAAEAGVERFHRAMDSGRLAEAYDASAPDMKSVTSRDQFITLFGAVHDRLGTYKSGKTVSWKDNANTDGHYVVLNRQAEFERGSATEDFVFRIEKGEAVLAGYHVTSNVLTGN
jgi:hypothetical protein